MAVVSDLQGKVTVTLPAYVCALRCIVGIPRLPTLATIVKHGKLLREHHFAYFAMNPKDIIFASVLLRVSISTFAMNCFEHLSLPGGLRATLVCLRFSFSILPQSELPLLSVCIMRLVPFMWLGLGRV